VENVSNPSTSAIPILVPCSDKERSDGIANFFKVVFQQDEHGKSTRSDTRRIRMLTQEDVDPQRIEQVLGDESTLLYGLLDLRQGLQQDDPLQRVRGFKKIRPGDTAEWSQALGESQFWARQEFPVLVTERLKDVRLVLWFAPEPPGRILTLALFCPDLQTGIFLKSFLEVRCCPYCERLFSPRANNIMYCTTAHRDAHRMNRYRRSKKAAEQRQKRTSPLPRTKQTKAVKLGKR